MSLLQALGWSFIHFLWQGGAIALVCWALLTLCQSAPRRYAIGCIGLLIMLAAPVATFVHLFGSSNLPIADPVESSPIPLLVTRSIAEVSPIAIAGEAVSEQSNWQAIGKACIPWLGRVWMAGIFVIAVWHAAGYVQLSRLRRHAAPLHDSDWIARLRHWKDRLSIRRSVSLLLSEKIDCPAVVGCFKPAILWPAAALTGLTPTQVDALLAHELAHIRRHDHVINVVQIGIETVLFFHPCVWWLSRRVRQEREHCCDDLAAGALGSRATYADALVAMESLRQLNALSLQVNGGSLMQRIQRLLETNTTARRTRGVHVVSLLIAAACAVSIWSSRTNASDTSATTRPTEPAPLQSSGALRSALIDLVSVRDELAAKSPTLSQFSPEVIELKNRERETMRTFVERTFAIVETNTWREQLNTEIRSIETDAPAQRRLSLSKEDLIELFQIARREAEVQLGKDAVIAVRLAEFTRDSVALMDEAALRSLARAEPIFERLLDRRDELRVELARMQASLAENAPEVMRKSKDLDSIENSIDDIAKALTPSRSQGNEARDAVDVAAHLATAKQLEQTLKELEVRSKQIAESQRKLVDLAETQSRDIRLTQLNQQRDEILKAIRDRRTLPDSNTAELESLLQQLSEVSSEILSLTAVPGEYYIAGNVTRPGIYSLAGRTISIRQALMVAGTADFDDETRITIVRRDPLTRKVSIDNFKWRELRDQTAKRNAIDLLLKANDYLTVRLANAATQPATTRSLQN